MIRGVTPPVIAGAPAAGEPAREAGRATGRFQAALVAAGEIDTSIGEALEHGAERTGGRSKGQTGPRPDHAGDPSGERTVVLDADIALAQAAAQLAARAQPQAPGPSAAQPAVRAQPQDPAATAAPLVARPTQRSLSSPRVTLPLASRELLRASAPNVPSRVTGQLPLLPINEASIRTVSAVAIANASRVADAIAHSDVAASDPPPNADPSAAGGLLDAFAAIDLVAGPVRSAAGATVEPAYDAVTIDRDAAIAAEHDAAIALGLRRPAPGPVSRGSGVFEYGMSDLAHEEPEEMPDLPISEDAIESESLADDEPTNAPTDALTAAQAGELLAAQTGGLTAAPASELTAAQASELTAARTNELTAAQISAAPRAPTRAWAGPPLDASTIVPRGVTTPPSGVPTIFPRRVQLAAQAGASIAPPTGAAAPQAGTATAAPTSATTPAAGSPMILPRRAQLAAQVDAPMAAQTRTQAASTTAAATAAQTSAQVEPSAAPPQVSAQVESQPSAPTAIVDDNVTAAGTSAAALERPVVASHRVPSGFARTVPAAGVRTKIATFDPAAIAAEAPAAAAAAAPAPTGELRPRTVTAQGAPSVRTGEPAEDAVVAAVIDDDNPDDAWPVSVPRTTSWFGKSPEDAAAAGIAAFVKPPITLMPIVDPATRPLSPLEQAVHDLVGRLTGHDGPDDQAHRDRDDEPAGVLGADLLGFGAPFAAQPASRGQADPVSEPGRPAPLQPPEPPANPSHVHLVVDDGPERVVVTVAMRGNDVHVAMRSSDDATTAALARNAASLDHAMRARGLTLGDLTAQHEPQHRDRHPSQPPPPRDPPDPQRRRKPHAEPFELEEKP